MRPRFSLFLEVLGVVSCVQPMSAGVEIRTRRKYLRGTKMLDTQKRNPPCSKGASFLLLLLLVLPGVAAAQHFSPTGSMTAGRRGHTATLLPNGKVLVAGGYATASAELYDPFTGSFSPTGSMSVTRYRHTATLLPNGEVLIAGGYDRASDSYPTSAELYDPASGTFSPAGTMSQAHYAAAATLLGNGKVLIAGTGSQNKVVSLYDPVTGTFSTSTMIEAQGQFTATLLASGKALVTGFSSGLGPAVAELYDPSTDTFSLISSPNAVRQNGTATLLADGRVLLAGGEYGGVHLSAELYDPTRSADSFSVTGSMSVPRVWHTATLLPNGKLLVTGGSNLTVGWASAELYDPATGTFSSTGSMSVARSQHTATLLPDGTVLIAGGGAAQSPSSAEVYLPSPTQTQCQPETDNWERPDLGDECSYLTYFNPLSQRWKKDFGDGSRLEVTCSLVSPFYPVPAYMLWYTKPDGQRVRIAQCLFSGAANELSIQTGHVGAGTARQSCLSRTRWGNYDLESNDGQRKAEGFAGEEVVYTTAEEAFLDALVFEYDASANKLSWKNTKYPYAGEDWGTDADLADIFSEERLPVLGLGTIVDPLVGAETEWLFDALWVQLQSEPPAPMRFIPGCDLDGNGACDTTDQALLESAVGSCQGQAGYAKLADLNGDGCVTAAEQLAIARSESNYRAGCTYSQGYWKTHAGDWPTQRLTIGGQEYSQAELLEILRVPIRGNGALSLARQIIAAKLNVAAGASPVAASLVSADALLLNLAPGRLPPLGSAFAAPYSVSSYVSTLDAYNRGVLGPPACVP